jgi:integrase
MPRLRDRPVTVKEIEALAKVPGRHSIGDGLILIVGTKRGRSWTCRIRVPTGERRDMGLGSYPEVSLAEARQRAADLRKMVRDGLDPIEERKKARAAGMTFAEVAEMVWEKRKQSFKNGKHVNQWIQTLRTYVFPKIGNMRVAKVDDALVAEVLEPIWMVKKETARRVLQRIADVTVHAKAKGYRPDIVDKRCVRELLAHQKITQTNFAAVLVEEAPEVYAKIKAVDSIASEALRFQILTALRPVVARSVRWEHIDLEHWLWVIPAKLMKTNKRHAVPLSNEAIDIVRLRQALPSPVEQGSPFVFPSPTKPDRIPISETSCRKVLKAFAPDTLHGWRATFKTWATDYTDYSRDLIEACLAHDLDDPVEAAYLRTTRLEDRLRVMQDWEDFLEGRVEIRHTLDAALRRIERAEALASGQDQELALSDPA